MYVGVVMAQERLAVLDSLEGTGNLLDGAKLHLYKNPLTTIPPDSEIASFTEADFTGYAAVTVTTWGDAFLDVFGRAVKVATSVQFDQTDDTATCTVYGWYLTDSAGTTLIAAGPLPEEVNMAGADSSVVALPCLTW